MKLVIFDVDGTLVDSQGQIIAAMHAAFADQGLEIPAREHALTVVGLSLPQAMMRLAPHADIGRLVTVYKDAFAQARRAGAVPPLYPGIADVLTRLATRDSLLLGIATGKSRRGLVGLLESHGLESLFVTKQVADDHPSKPHPSMLLTALSETGVAPSEAVMIGDTEYDIAMARAAGTASIGVTWGYHPRAALADASICVDAARDLEEKIDLALGRAS